MCPLLLYRDEPMDDVTHFFTICYILVGSSILSSGAGFVVAHFITPKSAFSHKWNSKKFTEATEKENRLREYNNRKLRSLYWVNHRVVSSGRYFIGWYSTQARYKIVGFFLFWVLLGTMYGLTFQQWPFITSLYFAVATCSTAALLGPTCLDNTSGVTCEIGAWNSFIVGTYNLIGIPGKAYLLLHLSLFSPSILTSIY
jgi:hypothetical protein